MIGMQAKELEQKNKKVWVPWWQEYLAKCDEFMAATKAGEYEKVARLINIDYAADKAVNVNYQEQIKGYAALHYAVESNDKKMANLLIKNYADVKVQNVDLQTPLHIACLKGHTEIFKELFDACYQAKESIDKDGKTPLDYARELKRKEILDFARNTTHLLYSIDS